MSTADSTRGLLITVLGEFMLPAGGAAWTQTLTATLRLLEVQDKAARQAINRLHHRGWFERTRVGRKTRLTLTPYATALLSDGAERIYGLGTRRHSWDGRWLMVLASMPERQRNVRYRLTVGLTWAGFGSLGQGTWISPWPEREREACRVLEELGVTGATSFVAELGMTGSPLDLAGRAWDMTGIADQYHQFLGASEIDLGGRSGETCVRDLVSVVHRWRRFPLIDPDLPAELLPTDWPGGRAAQRFAATRSALAPDAARWWAATDAALGD